jgi:hypothetical protein
VLAIGAGIVGILLAVFLQKFLIVEALRPGPGRAKILLIVLAVVGIAVQMGITARRRAD